MNLVEIARNNFNSWNRHDAMATTAAAIMAVGTMVGRTGTVDGGVQVHTGVGAVGADAGVVGAVVSAPVFMAAVSEAAVSMAAAVTFLTI
jgi:hypothetical protein